LNFAESVISSFSSDNSTSSTVLPAHRDPTRPAVLVTRPSRVMLSTVSVFDVVAASDLRQRVLLTVRIYDFKVEIQNRTMANF
jgi:hypothetical protein